jgi:hypothetical protein
MLAYRKEPTVSEILVERDYDRLALLRPFEHLVV